ncbi:MAG TPA: ATP-grasp domain-containing protein, partial [Burkholderiales bacterium]|nr:ATP-grasp domain-containing protein [Burkholderiales bacterium]
MMMLECDAKRLLASVGAAVPAGAVWRKGEPAASVKVAAYPVAVKAQVRSGGRGKQGGVVKVANATELAAAGKKLFATEFGGELPEVLLVEAWLAIEREAYLSVAVDGRAEGYVVLYSPVGGIDIEEGVPPARYPVGASWNFRVHELRAVLEKVEPDYQWREKVIALAQRLVRTAAARDCTTIEINPLVKLADGAMVAADAKIARDEWAHFRSEEIAVERDAEKARADEYLRACLDMQHMYVKL